MKRLIISLVLLAACGSPVPTTPVPTQELVRSLAAGACNLVPDLLYQGQPVYFGDCVPLLATDTPEPAATDTTTPEPGPTDTETAPPPTGTATPTPTATPEPGPTDTPAPTETPAPTTTPSAPFASAPLCPDHGSEHDNSRFHTLWDANRSCHYDHEHGASPFTTDVAAAFPGFDLLALLGGVQIGHTNPSSPVENVAKHGGYKWQVDLAAPDGCAVGFENGTVAVDAYAIQYHSFGPQSVEMEARNHSAAALLRQCKPGNPSDKGYIYVTTLQEFGERCRAYQGITLAYPDNFQPEWDCAFGPYMSTEGFGSGEGCRPSLAFYQQANAKNNTVWSSKRSGIQSQPRPMVARVFRFLYRGRDAYQSMDCADIVHPFTWLWVCGGAVYNPAGCKYNNSTITIQEVMGDIPAAWDNLGGWDTDTRVGRVSVEGFINQNGDPAAVCEAPGTTCYVLKLVSAFVGRYSSDVCLVDKCSDAVPGNSPERDIYFCGQNVCSETAPGAVPSSWIGPNN